MNHSGQCVILHCIVSYYIVARLGAHAHNYNDDMIRSALRNCSTDLVAIHKAAKHAHLLSSNISTNYRDCSETARPPELHIQYSQHFCKATNVLLSYAFSKVSHSRFQAVPTVMHRKLWRHSLKSDTAGTHSS